MGSISCHITPLVINSLGGRHTHTRKHTHTHTRIQTFKDRTNSKKPGALACGWCTPGLKIQQLHSYIYQKPLITGIQCIKPLNVLQTFNMNKLYPDPSIRIFFAKTLTVHSQLLHELARYLGTQLLTHLATYSCIIHELAKLTN